MKRFSTLLVVGSLAVASVAHADVYMHNPPGSNDRSIGSGTKTTGGTTTTGTGSGSGSGSGSSSGSGTTTTAQSARHGGGLDALVRWLRSAI